MKNENYSDNDKMSHKIDDKIFKTKELSFTNLNYTKNKYYSDNYNINDGISNKMLFIKKI